MEEPRLRLSKQAAEQRTKPKPKPIEQGIKQRDEAHALIRAKRKAQFAAAKESDKVLGVLCTKYRTAEALELEGQRTLKRMSVKVDELEKEAKDLDTRIKELQEKWRKKRAAYGEAKTNLNDFSVKLTVTKRLKRGIQEAWDACEEAWSHISRTFAKKHRDRKVKKTAKEILRDR